MKTFKSITNICKCVVLYLCLAIQIPGSAQTFTFPVRETSQLKKADTLVNKTLPFVLLDSVMSSEWPNLNSSYKTNNKLKSAAAYVRLAVNHNYPKSADSAYVYKVVYSFNAMRWPGTTAIPITSDSLIIGYDPDSLTAYQDIAIKKYSDYHKISSFRILRIEDISKPDSPVQVSLSSNSFKKRLNFDIQVSFKVQRYMKKTDAGGTTNAYNPGLVLQTTHTASTTNDFVGVKWNVNSGNLSSPPDVTPANYELEWTFVDDYGPNNSTISASSLSYNFRNNATRVWLDTNYYRIPLIYERGYIVYRVRMVRPDSIQYTLPVYSAWSVSPDSGIISSLSSSSQYYYFSTPHLSDSLNWQYTISFAEQGKYKHVLSYYDGILKNRQTITRFNSNLSDLLVTENVYDYEGRPSIKILPTPVQATNFRYQYGVSTNAITGLPYKAADFDTLRRMSCPGEYVPSELSSTSLPNKYYSGANSDTAGFQKYVPDANGRPFIQTIYAPDDDKKVDVQGGAGTTLQIGNGHETMNDYVGADQAYLDRLMGIDAGWEGFYKKVVTRDPNNQVSMSVYDYKGHPVSSCMIGTGPDSLTHAIVRNKNVPDSQYYEQELIAGTSQQTLGLSKILDKDFYMDAAGNDAVEYKFSLWPYHVPWCDTVGLSVAANYYYNIHDNCGSQRFYASDTIGFTGVVNAFNTVKDSSRRYTYLQRGKHSLHKELMVRVDEIGVAVDEYIATGQCLKNVHQFIKEEFKRRKLPCGGEYLDPCESKREQMKKDMYPITGKYGNFYYVDSVNDIVNGEHSIFSKVEPSLIYRYQDTCLAYPLNWIKGKKGYGNIRNLKPKEFIEAFNDTLAGLLLPLHPEYCKLMACFVDTFKERMEAMPDGITAEGQGLLLLKDIINADPLKGRLMGHPVYYTSTQVLDSLSTFRGGQIKINELVLAMAYCNCADSTMYKKCREEIFNLNIDSAILSNNVVKNYYFKNMLAMYLQNRERYIQVLASGNGDTCESCKLARIPVVKPAPLFPTTYSPNGGFATDPSSIWTLFSDTSISTAADVIKEMINQSADSLMKYEDSARRVYDENNLVLCTAQIDSILFRLANCIKNDTTLYRRVRDTLNNMCIRGDVFMGNYSPQQISYALGINGVSMNDMCNPYMVNYDPFTLFGKPTGLLCKEPTFYASMQSFLNRPEVLNKLITLSAPFQKVKIDPSFNKFEKLIKDTLGISNDTIRIRALYESSDNLYSLIINGNGKNIKVYLKSNGTAVSNACDSFFYINPGDSIYFSSVDCINELAGSMGDGYIASFGFIANVKRISSSVVTECRLLGWNDKIETITQFDNKLSGAIPCTEMRSMYKRFVDTMNAYGIVGTDHPYHDIMLGNFMNYYLQQTYTTDRYVRFVESCALADSMLMPKYVSYSSFKFSDTTGAKNFLTDIDAVDTTVGMSDACYVEWDSTSGNVIVLPDFDMVPRHLLWKFKDFASTYTISNNAALLSKLVNQPLHNWHDADQLGYGVYYYADTIDISQYVNTTHDENAFDSYKNQLQIPGSKTVYVKLGNAWYSCKKYPVYKQGSITTSHISGGLSIIRNNMLNGNPTYFSHTALYFLDDYQSTVDEDYYQKQSLLHYAYSAQMRPVGRVIDTLSEDSLNYYLYSTNHVTYTIPSNPGNTTNLYQVSDSNTRLDSLRMILDSAAIAGTIWPRTDGSIFLPLSDTAKYYPIYNMYIYRCSDQSYLYVYFNPTTSKMTYLFIRMPKYIPVSKHSDYLLTGIAMLPDDNATTRNFRVVVQNKYSGAYINAYGRMGVDCDLGNNSTLEDVLLANPINATLPDIDTFYNCEHLQILDARYVGRERYQIYIDSVKSWLVDAFTDHVMANLDEELYLGYMDQRFNITQYYYDRAGNLMRTVSPEGVVKLPNTYLKNVVKARTQDTLVDSLLPLQIKKSEYYYNTLNQVVRQKTPDGGEVDFYYDAAGRMVFSQNEKQRPNGNFTYNLYDRQGRIIETGQAGIACAYFAPRNLNDTPSGVYASCYSVDFDRQKFVAVPNKVFRANEYPSDSIINYVRGFVRTDVVRTVYDTVTMLLDTVAGQALSPQENLRKRVAAVFYHPVISTHLPVGLRGYDYATYYSYDIAGNVKTLVHDFPLLANYQQRYKRVDYDYDLISGKVNMLSYNRGHADQFYQRYKYDNDNRLVKAETSDDGLIWVRDAEYNYYKHGPLARMSLGDLRVQGVDYVYTIQGWLKAINSDLLDTTKDIGRDGKFGSVHSKDAMALSLQYFAGDYKSITGDSVNYLPNHNRSLYNGNISRQTVGIPTVAGLASKYTYDQLNRIVSAYYDSLGIPTKSVNPVVDYQNTYSYDQDGNLLTLFRKGNRPNSHLLGGSKDMDDLRYGYRSKANNKLKNVIDIDSNRYGIDIQRNTDTSLVYYDYDKIGNVIYDKHANQNVIDWNLYNKVTRTQNFVGKNNLTFKYDGAGNRVYKMYNQEKDTTFSYEGDYYVRDAQGNILAVYRSETTYKYQGLQLWKAAVGGAFVAMVGGSTFITDLMPLYAYDGPMAAAISDITQGNTAWINNQLSAHDVQYYFDNSSAVRSDMLGNGATYVLPLFAHNSGAAISNSWKQTFARNDESGIYDITNALFSVSAMKLPVLNKMCAADPGGDLIGELRTAYGLEAGANCAADATAIAGAITDMTSLAEKLTTAYTNQQINVEAWLDALAADDAIYDVEAYTGTGGTLLPVVQNSLGTYGDVGELSTFFSGWDGAQEYMETTTSAAARANTIYNADPISYMNAYATDFGADFLDTAFANAGSVGLDEFISQAMIKFPSVTTTWVENTLEAVRVNMLDRLYLAEHDIYGSSRLGIRSHPSDGLMYMKDYTNSQTTPLVINTLDTKRPWYSAKSQDLIKPDSIKEYSNADNSFLSEMFFSHTIGKTNYELTNHLGNVQAVVKDKRLTKALSGDSNLVYRPSLHAYYDYYPFGMLMPGRYAQDTQINCYTVTKYEEYQKSTKGLVALGVPGGFFKIGTNSNTDAIGTATLGESEMDTMRYLDISDNTGGTGSTTALNIPSTDVGYEQELIVSNITGSYVAIVKQEVDNAWVELDSREITATGLYTLEFTPTTTNVKLDIINTNTGSYTHALRLTGPAASKDRDVLPLARTYTICDRPRDSYRFGFNGKEKDNEFAGIGNFENYGFREYDIRIARFNAVDPLTKKYPYFTPYAFAGNTPIQAIDLEGLEILNINSSMYRMRYVGNMPVSTTNFTDHIPVNYTEVVNENVPSRFPVSLTYLVGTHGHNDYFARPYSPVMNGVEYSGAAGNDYDDNGNDNGHEVQKTHLPPYNGGYRLRVVAKSDPPTLTGLKAKVSTGLNTATGVVDAYKFLKSGFLGNLDMYDINFAEPELRDAYYKATNIVDKYMGRDRNKSYLEEMDKFNSVGSFRADLINFVTDGTRPSHFKEGMSSKQKEQYINAVNKNGTAIMKENNIPIRK